uniref:Somatoliberin n=1 Tax=Latimeria chalumnae TaxID=7897 RepID=H3AMK6_LATCH
MLDKATVLMFYCLTVHCVCSPLYPALRYDHGPAELKANSQYKDRGAVLDTLFSLDDQNYLKEPTEKRIERHADALFTNSYRKVLGQISARKFLQTIMGKRLGNGSVEEDQSTLVKRQSDGVHLDSYNHYYYNQMALRKCLASVLNNYRYQGNYGSEVAELMKTKMPFM